MMDRPPLRERPHIANTQFARRQYTLAERLQIAAIWTLVHLFGIPLRIGGRPLQRALCAALGGLLYLILKRFRHIALVNMDLVYGDTMSERDKRRLTRAMFRHFVRLGLDTIFDTVYWPMDTLAQRVDAINKEALDRVARQPDGFLAALGHHGNWELIGAVGSMYGYKFSVIFKRLHSSVADWFLSQKRLRYGYDLLEAPETEYEVVDGVRRELPRKSIRPQVDQEWAAGHCIGSLCDQFGGDRGMKLTFLGVPDVPTPSGALNYAVEYKKPIVLALGVYRGDRYRFEIGPVLTVTDQPGGHEATVRHYGQLINDWISEQIFKYPEQWTWGHRRFPRHYYAQKRPVRR